jgi:hypothetical protein
MTLGLRVWAVATLMMVSALVLPCASRAQGVGAPPSAASVVTGALTSAKSDRKVVLIEFGAKAGSRPTA